MMNINETIGENVRLIRKRLGLTQKDLADRVSDSAGYPVSSSAVSSWERGEKAITAEMIHHVCVALKCTSYALFPHSASVDSQDVALMKLITGMTERQKSILIHMLCKWSGDMTAFMEFGLLYASLPEYRRRHISAAGIEEFKEAISAGDVQYGLMPVDLAKIIRAWKNLEV